MPYRSFPLSTTDYDCKDPDRLITIRLLYSILQAGSQPIVYITIEWLESNLSSMSHFKLASTERSQLTCEASYSSDDRSSIAIQVPPIVYG